MDNRTMHAQLARTKLRSFIEAATFLDGKLERCLEQLQITVREARAASTEMGAVYAKELDGIAWPVETQPTHYRSTSYQTVEDFDKDVQDLAKQYGLDTVRDTNGRLFRVAFVPTFVMLLRNEQLTGA